MPSGVRVEARAVVIAWIGRLGPKALPLGLVIGLALPGLASVVAPLLTPVIVTLLTVSMLRVDPGQVLAEARRVRTALLGIAGLMVLSPVAVALALRPFDLDTELVRALVLYFAAPPILSSASIAAMLGLNGALAIVLLVLATLVAPFTLPPLGAFLLAEPLALDTGALAIRLGAVVLIAVVASSVLRALIGSARLASRSDVLDGLVVILMMTFAISIMAEVRTALIEDALGVAVLTGIVFLANAGAQVMALALLLVARVNRCDAMTLAMVSGNRNLGIVVAAAGSAITPEFFLFFALAQAPIFLLPQMLTPIYRWGASGADLAER